MGRLGRWVLVGLGATLGVLLGAWILIDLLVLLVQAAVAGAPLAQILVFFLSFYAFMGALYVLRFLFFDIPEELMLRRWWRRRGKPEMERWAAEEWPAMKERIEEQQRLQAVAMWLVEQNPMRAARLINDGYGHLVCPGHFPAPRTEIREAPQFTLDDSLPGIPESNTIAVDLSCAECGRTRRPGERWQLMFTDIREFAGYCPACAREQFDWPDGELDA